MAASDVDNELNEILQKTQATLGYKPLREEVVCLTSAFLPSGAKTTVRPKAYVVLSAIIQGLRDPTGKGGSLEGANDVIANLFAPTVMQYLGETADTPLLQGVTFLTALFQVDSGSACVIFSNDGLIENLMDTVDLSPSPLLCQEVAHLLGQACGHKTCRAIITPQIIRWLEFKSRQSSDSVLQSAATVALIKISKGSASDAPENGTPEVQDGQVDELTERLIALVVSKQLPFPVDAIEGLAYLTAEPSVKEMLSRNTAFLKQLFALVPQHKSPASSSTDVDATIVYGVLVIICNLTNFRPKLTQEQTQMEKLKQMAKAGKGLAKDTDIPSVLDDDDHVKMRIRLLIASGVLPVFPAAIAASDSLGVRSTIGRSLLNIIEEKENRGKVLQSGCARVLQNIIKQSMSSNTEGTKQNKQSNFTQADLEAIQALAKLSITAAPVQVYGPNVGMIYDAIRPFSTLLQHPSSNLLQRFEAIMALTNLASHDPETASRIANVDGLLDKVELLLLEEHVLVRRASVELICNLIAGSDDVFERYSGETSNSTSKIHVLLALSDVEDLPTRLASSGALATLSASPSVCNALVALQFEKRRFLPLMTQLIDPSCLPNQGTAEDGDQPLQTNQGLVHRGVVCAANFFMNVTEAKTRDRVFKEATAAGLLRALVQLVKGEGVTKDEAIVKLGTQALKSAMNKSK